MQTERPFVDRPVVDLDAATAVARAVAGLHGLPAPSLLRRGMNALYEAGDVVLRVGHATAGAAASHALVRVVRAHGVPTVEPVTGIAVDRDGFAVTGWTRVTASCRPADWEAVGAAVRSVHDVAATAIPADYPMPHPASFPWWDFGAMLRDVAAELDRRAADGLVAAIERHGGWATRVGEAAVVCHGDVHPGNVLVGPDGPLLIDWDLLCRASPAWDHAMLTTHAERWGGDPAVYRAFASGYGRSFADDDLTVALGELRNVAATLMRVRAGRTDPAAAAEAERRLAYWRGDRRDAWRAQ